MGLGPGYYNRYGEPLELLSGASLFDPENFMRDRYVRQEHVGPFWISTVLLVIDHNFYRVGPPLIFETMVFGHPDDDEVRMDRYPTEETALEGHLDAVRFAQWESLKWLFRKLFGKVG